MWIMCPVKIKPGTVRYIRDILGPDAKAIFWPETYQKKEALIADISSRRVVHLFLWCCVTDGFTQDMKHTLPHVSLSCQTYLSSLILPVSSRLLDFSYKKGIQLSGELASCVVHSSPFERSREPILESFRR